MKRFYPPFCDYNLAIQVESILEVRVFEQHQINSKQVVAKAAWHISGKTGPFNFLLLFNI